jgi:hypothetical protein
VDGLALPAVTPHTTMVSEQSLRQGVRIAAQMPLADLMKTVAG